MYWKVARVAEEAAGTIAKSLPPEICLQALSPVLREAEFPVNLAALKMTIKVWQWTVLLRFAALLFMFWSMVEVDI